MQTVCDSHGTQLWPHVKTHKTVEIARMQLEAGATGLVCSKVSEAEAILPSGVRRLFLAHSLVDPRQAPRLRALAEALDELVLACTSRGQAEALGNVLHAADLRLPVLLAVDTGLGREGVRSENEAVALAEYVQSHPRMTLRGLYTHEGHAYGSDPGEVEAIAQTVFSTLVRVRDRIDSALSLWPGCSVTATRMAVMKGVTAVRPGTYVFGDLSLAARHRVMPWSALALTVLSTVVDRPTSELALLDAGSKTLSGDKTPQGYSATLYDLSDVHVIKCSEEHGWAGGGMVDTLQIGQRVRLVPAHVCPVVNLADELAVLEDGRVVDTWRVAARGCVQ